MSPKEHFERGDDGSLVMPEHPLRRAMVDELHARPFIPMSAPTRVLNFAFAVDAGASPAERAAAQRAHLLALFARERAAPPDEVLAPEGPVHVVADLGGFLLKWERHTEFVSYLLTFKDPGDAAFDDDVSERIGRDWLASAPGPLVSACHAIVERVPDAEEAERAFRERLPEQFVGASMSSAWLADRSALAVGDFRIDAHGFTRFAVVATDGLGPRRIGRITQRLIEMETYRAMAMLALPTARGVSGRLAEIDRRLLNLVTDAADAGTERSSAADQRTLTILTETAADIERISAESSFRFSAARAYEAIVDERLDLLRAERVGSRQSFREFMVRRFKPAMRTCRSAEDRLASLAARAERAANLLRTRVDVALEAQNQTLLRSMDDRARLQLRLQQTVEGLSVVAISYYALNLAGYLAAPAGDLFGLGETALKALLAVPVIVAVWLVVRRIRKNAEQAE